MRNVIHRIKAGHVLFLQEVDRVAFALGEQGDEDIGARHFFTARGLDMDGGALQNTLESGWLVCDSSVFVIDEIGIQFLVDIGGELRSRRSSISMPQARSTAIAS
jgi:hypothetical protein